MRERARQAVFARHGICVVAALVLAATTGGCRGMTSTKPPVHLNPSMDNQPNARAQSESDFVSGLKEKLALLERVPEPALNRAARTLLDLRVTWESTTKEERKDLVHIMTSRKLVLTWKSNVSCG